MNLETLLDQLSGLRPLSWLCVGAGFGREAVKSLLLSQGRGLTSQAILTPTQLCLQLVQVPQDRLLQAPARVEVLRLLVAQSKVLEKIPEIKRLKRSRKFFSALDEALQSGRMSFAHFEEEAVYEERFHQRVTQGIRSAYGDQGIQWNPLIRPVRAEIRLLAHAYEAWLLAMGYWDLPLLMRTAVSRLRDGWPQGCLRPQAIHVLSVQTPESLEREFWDALRRFVSVSFHDRWVGLKPSQRNAVEGKTASGSRVRWDRWHTLDDAAEHLGDELSAAFHAQGQEALLESQTAVLIPDQPSVRRSLMRALKVRQVPLAEPRDPTRLRMDEQLKWALLPLELVARNFERQKVIRWLRGKNTPQFASWVLEINARGIQGGLASYSGGSLVEVHQMLRELHSTWGGRKTAQVFSELHVKFLKECGSLDLTDRVGLVSFFEQTWKSLVNDLAQVGLNQKKAPLLFWFERLKERIAEASPPADQLKPTFGLSVYRLQQAPIRSVKKLWVLGLPASFFAAQGVGDLWFSERERDVLGYEFAIRSNAQVASEKLTVLQSWIDCAEEVVFLDAMYNEGGGERESLLPIFSQLVARVSGRAEEGHSSPDFKALKDLKEPHEQGGHPRFQKSFASERPLQPQVIKLAPLHSRSQSLNSNPSPQSGVEISATALDRYSRCSFQALGYHRWRLKDIREPDLQLWPEAKGNLLHEALRLLMSSLAFKEPDEVIFELKTRDALERAWLSKPPQGLIRNPRIEAYFKSKLQEILDAFCEKELVYLKRSQSRPRALDNWSLRLDYPGFSIRGQPDRIDEHPDGLFILDYKTSSSLPHGLDMVELGYRLQLPFYAVAVAKKTKRPVLGVQFVELDRRGSRKSGIFFDRYNGKEEGCLTQVRSNSRSLMPVNEEAQVLEPKKKTKKKEALEFSPERAWEVTSSTWKVLETKILQEADAMIQGHYRAQPKLKKRESECGRCGLNDLCGMRRLAVLENPDAE